MSKRPGHDYHFNPISAETTSKVDPQNLCVFLSQFGLNDAANNQSSVIFNKKNK